MYEKEAINRASVKIKDKFSDNIISIYAFGSNVRGDHGDWSDLDVLVIVRDKNPEIEDEVISIFADEELKTGIPFAPVIKDIKIFEMEKKFNTTFYRNIMNEGVLI